MRMKLSDFQVVKVGTGTKLHIALHGHVDCGAQKRNSKLHAVDLSIGDALARPNICEWCGNFKLEAFDEHGEMH